MFGARFDDVPSGESFVLTDPVGVLVAHGVDEVAQVVAEASGAAAEGNWVAGYVAYEAAPAFDASLAVRQTRDGPLAWFGVFGSREAVPPAAHDVNASGAYSVSQWSPDITRDEYRKAFRQIRGNIEDGDTYQVNLTFPLRAAFTGNPDIFYIDLVTAQKPSYAAHIWHDERHILSVSPERFFSIDDRRITTQPMKGTAPRGRWTEEDDERRRFLLRSDKDKAENLMIVDLLRNDLGRIAVTGSVSVDDLFSVEQFRTVWQMTSTITAETLEGVGLVDVFQALFPCGSVTGAPKGRSMGIIAGVEHTGRGVYCGAVGFVPPGDGFEGASFNVAIRTVEIDETEGIAKYGVGGALTWDSEEDAEFDEAVTKSGVLRFDVSPMKLLEAIRWDDDYLWRDDHLARMQRSAEFWSFTFDRPAIEIMLDDLGEKLDVVSKVRIVAQANGLVRVTSEALSGRWAHGPGPSDEPVKLALDLEPIDDRNPRLFHKTSDRRVFRVRAERHPGVDDVLLMNRAGNVTETSIANIVLLFDDTWVTPPISEGLLGGVMRAHLLADGIIEERSVAASEALHADAIAVVSSVRGWRAAVIIADA
ncbi:MAG: aminodeoxychorismate synthase component I [Acidimicrobiia bacterium]|nr:MAG: aminodeoxychorismate synthase component I [Acidimicrobiia bacterium]